MKTAVDLHPRTLVLMMLLFVGSNLRAVPGDSLSFDHIMLALNAELNYSSASFHKKQKEVLVKLKGVEETLAKTAGRHPKRYRAALEEKLHLMETAAFLEAQIDVSQLKVRYRKGIDLIRLMYEKILGLDHHFTGLRTYQHINELSNPHTYPGFQKAQETLAKNKNKKYNMRLPALLETNPFISATYTLVSVIMGENSPKEKEKEMEDIACILDFTLRMNADLNTIRNETEFLKNANQALKEDCERLFQEYTKPVEYLVRLEDCRTNDDWDSLFQNLEDLLRQMEEDIAATNGLTIETSRNLVNLEFATQRVIDFITKYSNFIGQGTRYYQKFDHIVNTYQYEAPCQEQLPRQYSEMKADIRSTIDKFNNTYDLPELQGSRLKNLMFGVTD